MLIPPQGTFHLTELKYQSGSTVWGKNEWMSKEVFSLFISGNGEQELS